MVERTSVHLIVARDVAVVDAISLGFRPGERAYK